LLLVAGCRFSVVLRLKPQITATRNQQRCSDERERAFVVRVFRLSVALRVEPQVTSNEQPAALF
jgi:hypothetical protein